MQLCRVFFPIRYLKSRTKSIVHRQCEWRRDKRANTVNCSRRAWASNCSSNNLDVAKTSSLGTWHFSIFHAHTKQLSRHLTTTRMTRKFWIEHTKQLVAMMMFLIYTYVWCLWWDVMDSGTDLEERAMTNEKSIKSNMKELSRIFFNDSRVFRPPCVSLASVLTIYVKNSHHPCGVCCVAFKIYFCLLFFYPVFFCSFAVVALSVHREEVWCVHQALSAHCRKVNAMVQRASKNENSWSIATKWFTSIKSIFRETRERGATI